MPHSFFIFHAEPEKACSKQRELFTLSRDPWGWLAAEKKQIVSVTNPVARRVANNIS